MVSSPVGMHRDRAIGPEPTQITQHIHRKNRVLANLKAAGTIAAMQQTD